MLQTIKVTPNSTIYIGIAGEALPTLLPDSRIVVITDATIHNLYPQMIAPFEHIIIGEGETNKNLQSVEQIYRQLIEMGADRKTFLLGIGGGIVSDITGFVAATYMRGIDFGFISTTLLSQVDAGVGGKNGVNLDGFKNMVGTFNQPRFVVCATDMLTTLNDREFRAGLAELIKSAIIANEELFTKLEQTDFEQLRTTPHLIDKMIAAAVQIKAQIVSQDEREAGERRKLNLGHTFAHAIEKLSRAMNHGEAVAAGMVIVADMALKMEILSPKDHQRIVAILDHYHFETTPPLTTQELATVIGRDKKAEAGSIHMVLPCAIGSCTVKTMTIDEIERQL